MMRNSLCLLLIIPVLTCCNNADNKSKSTATKKDNIINSNNGSTEKNTAATATGEATDSTLQYAYIKNVIKTTDSVFIITDFIQYLTGDEAVAAAKKNGEADTAYDEHGKITSVYVANDYYILNSSKKLRQLALSKACMIETLVLTTLKKTTLENFIKKQPFDNLLFKLEIKNAELVKISEVYMP